MYECMYRPPLALRLLPAPLLSLPLPFPAPPSFSVSLPHSPLSPPTLSLAPPLSKGGTKCLQKEEHVTQPTETARPSSYKSTGELAKFEGWILFTRLLWRPDTVYGVKHSCLSKRLSQLRRNQRHGVLPNLLFHPTVVRFQISS